MRRLATLLLFAPLACEDGAAGLSPSLGGADVIGASGDATDGSADGDDIGTSDSGDGADGATLDTVDTDSVESDVWTSDDTLVAEDVGAFEDVPPADDVGVPDDVSVVDVEPSEDVGVEPDVTADDVTTVDDTSPLEDVPSIEDVAVLDDVAVEEDTAGTVDTSPEEDVPTIVDVPPIEDVASDPDAGAADAGAPDVPPPLGPETAWFRLNDMDFIAPALCLPGPGSCLDITSFANTYLGPVFSDTVDPTDIVLSFTQPDGSTTAAVELGEGDCVRSGEVIVSCGIGDPPPPASFDATVSTVDACLGVAAPCFGTSEVLPSLAVQVGTFQIGLSNAEVAGRIVGAAPERTIEDGLLQGFLPEKIAKTLTVDAPVFGVLSVAQLLAKAPLVSVNGQPGWMVEFSFAAAEVPGP